VKPLHRDGVLIAYGRGPGAIAVIEKKLDATAAAQPQGGDRHEGLQLPDVTIGSETGKELSTPLGTVITFERAGLVYTVLGSVPRAAAESAARGL